MPLVHGKSQKAFQKNVKTEMHHGKPQGQALAIAYSIKRKAEAHKKAFGGHVSKDEGVSSQGHDVRKAQYYKSQGMIGSHPEKESKQAQHASMEAAKHEAQKRLHKSRSIKPKLYAMGGEVLMEHEAKESPEYEHAEHAEHAGQKEMHEELHSPHLPAKEKHLEEVFHKEEMASGMEPHGKYHAKHNMPAEHEDARKLGQHGSDEVGPQHSRMAHGGKVKHYAYGGLGEYHGSHELHGVEEGHEGEDHEMDMVGRIMKKRQHMYSQGGMVANASHPEFANRMPAEYDYLAKYDDMEDRHSAGNLHGSKLNQEPVHEDHDIVSRIMRKRHGK